MTRDPRVKKSCNADEADLRRRLRWESHRLGGVQGCGAHATARSWHRMKFSEVLVLLAAGTLGGIFSTVVSIASLVSYPVLLGLGVRPRSGTMTNTVARVRTGAVSVVISRPELAGQGRLVLRLGVLTALGGAAGAAVLLVTPASTFTVVVPVLIAAASVVLLVQPRIGKLAPAPEVGHPLAYGIALFAVAMYVGYFGAAAGVMLLVVLSTMIEESL